MKKISKPLFLFFFAFLSGCGISNEYRLENHIWQVQLNDSLSYQVTFKDNIAEFNIDDEVFWQVANDDLDLSDPTIKDFLSQKKDELNFNIRYHIEGDDLNLIQSIHTAKHYKLTFDDENALLYADDGNQIILKRVK